MKTICFQFTTSGRAPIIRQATTGSTGQPYFFEFGNRMSFRVSTKRVFFPDGSPFEGIGVTPGVQPQPTLEDMRRSNDVVLTRALELARRNLKES